MKKTVVFLLIFAVVFFLVYSANVFRDYHQLHENIIRLHVVANSNSPTDQAQKLLVRDAILNYLQTAIPSCADKNEAYMTISSQIVQLQTLANNTLAAAGSQNTAQVTMCEEMFDTRHYDTFSLPSGIYSSLRIKIGDAQGKNWWCVVFPSLCAPSDLIGFETTAVAAGFDDGLCKTISNGNGLEIRFYFLDLIGKIENFFKTSDDDL